MTVCALWEHVLWQWCQVGRTAKVQSPLPTYTALELHTRVPSPESIECGAVRCHTGVYRINSRRKSLREVTTHRSGSSNSSGFETQLHLLRHGGCRGLGTQILFSLGICPQSRSAWTSSVGTTTEKRRSGMVRTSMSIERERMSRGRVLGRRPPSCRQDSRLGRGTRRLGRDAAGRQPSRLIQPGARPRSRLADTREHRADGGPSAIRAPRRRLELPVGSRSGASQL